MRPVYEAEPCHSSSRQASSRRQTKSKHPRVLLLPVGVFYGPGGGPLRQETPWVAFLFRREELERDRLELEAELAHRGPTQASKASGGARSSGRKWDKVSPFGGVGPVFGWVAQFCLFGFKGKPKGNKPFFGGRLKREAVRSGGSPGNTGG